MDDLFAGAFEAAGEFPTQDDLDWLAALTAQEQAERERIEREYPTDPAYDWWLGQVDACAAATQPGLPRRTGHDRGPWVCLTASFT